MRVSYFLLVLALGLVFNGCKKEEQPVPKDVEPIPSILELNFRALWDSEPMVMNTTYDYPGNLPLRFGELDYIISNMRLVKADGSTLPLADVAFINFSNENSTLQLASEGITLKWEDLDAGESYTGIILGIGLDSLTNTTKPQDYPTGHPLSISANRYWEGWSSYIYSKWQGLADFDGDGVFTNTYAYHAGGQQLYREILFPLTFTTAEGKTNRYRFDLEAKELMHTGNGTYWDIRQFPSAHNPNNPAMLVMMDNFATALTMSDN